ncbi:mechanosensitive channel MscK [Pseudomonas sp. F1_0610]|uniref:mechanosensitive channel MscK n=1 Tax=Pseudomonas sp. F1_0610 TaxID=3114284 RepID=UPI0039C45F54
MLRLKAYLIGMLTCFCFISSAWAVDQAAVQQALDTLESRNLPEADFVAAQKNLKQALTWLQAEQEAAQAREALAKQLLEAPTTLENTRKQLQELLKRPEDFIVQQYANKTLEEQEQAAAAYSQELSIAQNNLSQANAMYVLAQTRPERAQVEINSNLLRLQEIAAIIKSSKEGTRVQTDEKLDSLRAERQALEMRDLQRQEELAGNNTLQDLSSAQRDLHQEQVTRLELYSQQLQELISRNRQTLTEQTVREQSQQLTEAGNNDLLVLESKLNLKLSDYLLQTTEKRNVLIQQSLKVNQQLASVKQIESALDEQINVLKGSLLLSKILYQQRLALPKVSVDKSIANDIADVRLYQFTLRQMREQISKPEEFVNQKILESGGVADQQLQAALLDLISVRSTLLDRLNRELNLFLSDAISLQLGQQQLEKSVAAVSKTLDEQMFWIPSNKPLNWEWIKNLPQQLVQQWVDLPVQKNSTQLTSAWMSKPWIFLPFFLVISFLIIKRKKLAERLQQLNKKVGHLRHDSQLLTPKCILYAVYLALPLSLFFALAGVSLILDGNDFTNRFAAAFFEMALIWLVFNSFGRLLAEDGIAVRHFHWAADMVGYLRRKIHWLTASLIILVAIVSLAQQHPNMLEHDVLGFLLLVACLFIMGIILVQIALLPYKGEKKSHFKRLVGVALASVPLVLIGALVMGYYYTTLQLTGRLIDTLTLVVVWVVLEATIVRGLAVAARRLAWHRALQDRQAQQAKEGDNEIVLEEPRLEISQINQQSLRLFMLALWAGFFVFLYWIWVDLLGVMSYLDNIVLYQTMMGSGDAASLQNITLRSLFGALIVAVVTIALARNLPGLLEMLVLSRLNLVQGGAYATTTILSYAIIASGAALFFASFGVTWDKLQWLVTALLVGLGFGLQEIFANFVSGIILLFERPIRIGDVITISGQSGTVSRIRIRATTITDFDRKEMVIPNKTFVTGSLTNWTLTDSVTRIVLTIGFAYEVDLPKARELIQQALKENPRILRDPAPSIVFSGISASTFDHEVRFFVRELGDRNLSTDEMLNRLVVLFREHNIDMAFNQLDVFIKNNAGQEVQLESPNKLA